jgi:hypothetical protein
MPVVGRRTFLQRQFGKGTWLGNENGVAQWWSVASLMNLFFGQSKISASEVSEGRIPEGKNSSMV